jgi:hypothetical protein
VQGVPYSRALSSSQTVSVGWWLVQDGGATPLHFASSPDIVSVLIKAGANCTATADSNVAVTWLSDDGPQLLGRVRTLFTESKEARASINIPYKKSGCLLHIAVLQGRADVVALLLEVNKINIEAVDAVSSILLVLLRCRPDCVCLCVSCHRRRILRSPLPFGATSRTSSRW